MPPSDKSNVRSYLSEMPASEAFANLKTNAHAHWPDRHEDTNRVEPICAPHFTAPFSMQPGSSVFTIGSCFARNVENSLLQQGFDVPARRLIGADVPTNVLNTFTAPSMLNEVRWALDSAIPFDPDTHLYRLSDTKTVDLHLSKRWATPTTRQTALDRRAIMQNAYAALPHCQMLILTLGLAEAWFDAELGHYVNTAPLKRMIAAQPDRFRLRVMRQADVVEALHQLITLASAANQVGGLNCVLTVSPVPLHTTFRKDTDVIVANAYSKAVLRTAAEEIAYSFDNVAYFPSFESITLSDRHEAWETDQVHVRQSLVDENVARMTARYVHVGSGEITDPNILAQLAVNAIKAGDHDAALKLAERALAQNPKLHRAQLAKAQCLAALKHPKAALAGLLDAYGGTSDQNPDLAAAPIDIQTFAARLLLRLKQHQEAADLATVILNKTPKHMPSLILLGEAQMGLNDLETALATFTRCLDISKRQGLPYFKIAQLEKRRGNKEAAHRMIDIALHLNPEHTGFTRFKASLLG